MLGFHVALVQQHQWLDQNNRFHPRSPAKRHLPKPPPPWLTCTPAFYVQAANAVGYGGASYAEVLASVRVPQGRYDFFVELHIEQVGTLLHYVLLVSLKP